MFRSLVESEAEAIGAALPYLDADPTRAELPTTEDGTPMPVQFISNGSAGVTGSDGDVCIAVPNGSGGVDVVVAADTSASLTVGIDTGGLL